MGFNKYFEELKRRNVFKAGLAYLVVSWVIVQVSSILLTTFEVPLVIMKTIITVLVIGFPIWIVFSWVYEITPEGIRKTVDVDPKNSIIKQTGNRLNKIIIGSLAFVAILLVFNLLKSDSVNAASKSTAAAEPVEQSIAVLAFADLSPESDQEYFSDGISEELLNLLAKIPELRVISRTSSFSYKGKGTTVETIGKELKVNHVLEGSVRKSGNQLRITAQLISTADGAHVWSETFDRELDDIFKIQDEIAAIVTEQLQLRLFSGLVTAEPSSTEAYNLFLQARQLYHQRTQESVINALALTEKSIALDSTYAPSWILLSDLCERLVNVYVIDERREIRSEQGRSAVKKALSLDPENGYAYIQHARNYMNARDYQNARLNIQRGLNLDPGNSESLIMGAHLLTELGQPQEGIQLIRKSISLDPLNYGQYFNLGILLYFTGNLEEALEAIGTYSVHFPNSGLFHNIRARIYMDQGNYSQALAEANEESDEFWRIYAKAMVLYKVKGGMEEAEEHLEKLKSSFWEGAQSNIADIYAFRGEKENAFHWLNRAITEGDNSLVQVIYYPSFKSLYHDPRWEGILNKLGLQADHWLRDELP